MDDIATTARKQTDPTGFIVVWSKSDYYSAGISSLTEESLTKESFSSTEEASSIAKESSLRKDSSLAEESSWPTVLSAASSSVSGSSELTSSRTGKGGWPERR